NITTDTITLTQNFDDVQDIETQVSFVSAKPEAVAAIVGGRFQVSNTSAANTGASSYAQLDTAVIDISGRTASITLNASSTSGLEESGTYYDFAQAFYRIDNGSWVSFGLENGDTSGGAFTFQAAGLTGSTLEVRWRAKTTSTIESYYLDELLVELDTILPPLS
ncbi:MAG: hypothetical protein AAF078_01350, partial [Planctomycetota bacterium]